MSTTPAPFTMVIKETGNIVGFVCSTCRMPHYLRVEANNDDVIVRAAEQAARDCCDRRCACGNPITQHYYTACDLCRVKLEVDREHERFTQAKKVHAADYQGWVCANDVGRNDGYFESTAALLEYCTSHKIAIPLYAWACRTIGFSIDVDNVLENALQDHHEDAGDNIAGNAKDALQYMLDAWCEKQEVRSYEQDTDLAVILRADYVINSTDLVQAETTSTT